MTRISHFALAAGAAFGLTAVAHAAVAVIPDVGTYVVYGSGDALVTYDSVVFSQRAAIDPNAVLFNVSPGFSGASVPVLSSQEQIGGIGNILITLPYAVHSVSFSYGTFDGGMVNFTLSNGALFTLGSSANGYTLGSTFATTQATAFTSIQLLYPDVTSFPVLNIGDVTYGAAVPEPAAWGMLLAGFALTGAALRRRTALAA